MSIEKDRDLGSTCHEAEGISTNRVTGAAICGFERIFSAKKFRALGKNPMIEAVLKNDRYCISRPISFFLLFICFMGPVISSEMPSTMAGGIIFLAPVELFFLLSEMRA